MGEQPELDFDQLVSGYAVLNTAREKTRAQLGRLRAVSVCLADRYESYEAMREAHERVVTHKCQIASTEQILRDLESRLQAKGENLLALLPPLVWVRSGDWAVGRAVTNWGGHKDFIVVQPWCSDLPTLDHNYRGD